MRQIRNRGHREGGGQLFRGTLFSSLVSAENLDIRIYSFNKSLLAFTNDCSGADAGSATTQNYRVNNAT